MTAADGERRRESAQIGLNLIDLANRMPEWQLRRAEQIEYLDHAVARRSVQVEIDLGAIEGLDNAAAWPRDRGGLLIPLAILSRRQHFTIEVVDESSAVVPRAVRSMERALLLEGLLSQAKSVLGRPPPLQLRNLLSSNLLQPPGPEDEQPWKLPAIAGGPELAADRVFHFERVLQQLTTSYYMVIWVDLADGLRRVFTYRYLDEVPPADPVRLRPRPLLHFLRHDIGRRAITAETPGAGDCMSYHLDFPAPIGLEIHDARLDVQGPSIDTQPPKVGRAVNDSGSPTRAHLFLSFATPVSAGGLSATLRLLPTGLPRAAVASVSFTGLVVLAGTLLVVSSGGHFERGVSAEAVVAVLLAPGAIGSVLAIPSRHNMTSELLWPTRALLGLASGATLIPTAVTAAGIQGMPQMLLWTGSLALIGWCLTILMRQYLRLRR